jgi:hypothetical protein
VTEAKYGFDVIVVMDSILDSVDWGQRSISLLERINELDTFEPVIMNIRHTERHPITWDNNDNVLCTERGISYAREFGAQLPAGWIYRLWHTSSPRTLETCKAIVYGLEQNGVESKIMGEPRTEFVLDNDRFVKIRNGYQVFSDGDESAITLLSNWNKNRYPADVITPPSEFGKGIAHDLSENLDVRCFHILVSHDVWVAALMESWIQVHPDDWVKCLDGFLVQLKKDRLKTIQPHRTHETGYPSWWIRRGP